MKRVMRITSLALVFAMLLGISAMAAERYLGAGFYGIGSHADVTVEARDADNTTDGVNRTSATVGETVKAYFEGSARLSVTYSGAAEAGDQFLVLLMDQNSAGIPDVNDAIWYINQEAKSSGDVVFDVYPIVPTDTTDMTLYITSNRKDFETISIPVSYAVEDSYTEAPYVLGDVNEDGKIESVDALRVLRAVAKLTELTSGQQSAADVNRDGKVESVDALRILRYVAKQITEF